MDCQATQKDLEARLTRLEIEAKRLDRQRAWMMWPRIAWLAMVVAGGIYLIVTHPG